MADNRTMAQLLQAPTEGYEDAISKSKVRNSRNKAVVAKVSSNSSTPGISPDVAALTTEVSELKNMMKTMLVEKQKAQTPAPVKAVEQSCVTCGGAHSYRIEIVSNDGNIIKTNIQDLKVYHSSGVAYKGPTIPTTSPKVVECETEVTKDTMPPTNNGSTEDVQPSVVPVVHHESISEPVNALVSASMPNQKTSIPFPSRRNDERRREKANDQIEKFYEIFRDLSFEISFTDALMLMPKSPDSKTLIGKQEKTRRCILLRVYEGEITLRVGKEAITFNLDQTSRYTANYNHMTANRIDVIDMACEEYSQEVLGFSNSIDPTHPEVDPTYYDPDGDILLLEAILNSDPSPPPPNQGNYFLEIPKDLKICEANNEKSSVNEPPELELKDLPLHLEYAFLGKETDIQEKDEEQSQKRQNSARNGKA
ncbi:hypothetical protein Tco_0672455 [Tanacetum coccineum]